MTALNILFDIFIVFLLGILLAVLIMIIRVSYAVYRHACKHCGGIMDYKGLKENEKESHYLFHCPNCGAWEQIKKEDFYRKISGFDVKEHGQTSNS